MDISNKLIQIAENTPKVYAAGERAGYKKCEEEYNEEFSISGSLVETNKGILEAPYNIISVAEPSNKTIDFMHCGWWTKNVIDLSPYKVWDKWYIRTSNGDNYQSTANQKAIRDYIPVAHLRGLTLTLNHPVYEYSTGYTGGVCFYTEKSVKGFISGTSKGLIQVPDNAIYMRLSWNPDYDTNELQFELGESTTDFEPYSGRWISETFPPNIVGAMYNWNTGVLTKTHHGDKLSDFQWGYNEDNGYYYTDIPGIKNDSRIMLNDFVYTDHDTIVSGGYSGEEIWYSIDVNDWDNRSLVVAVPYETDFYEMLDTLQPYIITELDTPDNYYFKSCPAGRKETSIFLTNSLGTTTVSNRKNTDTSLQEIQEAGTKAGMSDLLDDVITQNGARTDYERAFCRWNCKYIRPSFKVVPTTSGGGYHTFAYNPSLQTLEAKYFDFSQKPKNSTTSQDYGYFLRNCTGFKRLEDIGMQVASGYAYTFYYCEAMHTIDVLRSDENTAWNNAFSACKALQNLTIEGTIAKNGFSVSACVSLSKKSIESIIAALSTTTTGLTVTFSAASVNKAFETSEGANDGSTSTEWTALTAEHNNWTIALA